MRCKRCGKEINEKSRFCEYCGARVEYSVKDNPGGNKAKNSPGNAGPQKSVIIGVVILAVLLIAGGITGVVCLLEGKKDTAADMPVEVTEESASSEETAETAEESAAPATPDETAAAAPPENVQTVQKGDILIADCRSKATDEGQVIYPWQDAGEQVIVVSEKNYPFNNQIIEDSEAIEKNIQRAVGKAVGDTFSLKMVGDDGAIYTYKYTIKEIVEVDERYDDVIRMYLNVYQAAINDEDFSSLVSGDLEYNPDFLTGLSESEIPVFYVEDINGDGIQELFIAKRDPSRSYEEDEYSMGSFDAVYTLNDGKPVLFERITGKRMCWLCENGIIRCTDGDTDDMYGYGYITLWETLSPDGTEIEEIDATFYYDGSGSLSEAKYTHFIGDQEIEITEAEEEEIRNKYPLREPKYIRIDEYID